LRDFCVSFFPQNLNTLFFVMALMNLKVFALVTAVALVIGALTASNLVVVNAAKCDNGTPCDGWGDSTSDAATNDGKAVGEHTRDADANGDEPGRDGLGNFAGDNSLTGNKNPSDLGDAVNGQLP
jgi:hypothetical protein